LSLNNLRPIPQPFPDSLLADWIADSTENAYPLVSAVNLALDWSDERTAAAIDDGVKAGTLQRWNAGFHGPAITLSAFEADRRGLRVWGVRGHEFAFGWRPKNTRDRQPRCSIREVSGHKVVTDSDLEHSDESFNGQIKEKGSGKPTVAKIARAVSAPVEYAMAIEYLNVHPRAMQKPEGMRVMQAKAKTGVMFIDPHAKWPDPSRNHYEEPGQPPKELTPKHPCPVCHGWKPEDGKVDATYCLRCDRCGADGIIPPTQPLPVEDPPRRGQDVKPRKRKGLVRVSQ
jgi:hypothetical protein